MLYSLFIYQSDTGLLLWEKNFGSELNLELFSSFFSAIQSFVKDMIANQTQTLKNLEMGNFIINITRMEKLKLDIVSIADRGDEKPVSKFVPKILKILKEHKELFSDWDGNRRRFDVLDIEILKILSETKALLGNKSLGENKNEMLNAIMEKLPDLEQEQKEKYLEERKFLQDKLKETTSIPKKLEILDNIDMINQKLKDKLEIQRTHLQRKKLISELKNVKEKLSYFLNTTKQSISRAVEGIGYKGLEHVDLKDAYLNLYSFSSKLRLVGRDDLSDKYRQIAKIFIDKPDQEKRNIPNYMTQILKLPDDINEYIKKE